MNYRPCAVFLALALLASGCSSVTQKKAQEVQAVVDKAVHDVVPTVKLAVAVAGVVAPENQTTKAVTDAAYSFESSLGDVVSVVVAKGDTLWDLCDKAYRGVPQAPAGRGSYLWPLVCTINGLQDCNRIEVGQVISLFSPHALAMIPEKDVKVALAVAYAAPGHP